MQMPSLIYGISSTRFPNEWKMVIPQASDYAGPRYRHIAGLPGCRTEGFGRRPGRSELSATATVDQGPAAITQQKRQDVG